MKNLLFALVFITTVATSIFAFDPPASPKMIAEGKDMKITYGQPSKRGRDVFGALVPYGKVWRTGANEATEITFTKDVIFAGKDLKAGTYVLFTIPEKDNWTVILNSKTGQWGAYDYDKVKDKDVLKVQVPVVALKESSEKLMMAFDAKGLNIYWDMTSIVVPISTK